MASARICLQWTLIAFNTLSVIFGILAIVACFYELQRYSEGSAEYTEKIVQVCVAALLVTSAFVGCLGAVNGYIKVLLAFIVILITLMITHIWKLWHYNEARQLAATEKILIYAWLEELVKPGAMDAIQYGYECCGKKGSVDYSDLHITPPPSCYRFENGLHSMYPFPEGCETALKRAYLAVYRCEKLLHWLFMCFESVGILLSIILICKLLAKSRRYNY